MKFEQIEGAKLVTIVCGDRFDVSGCLSKRCLSKPGDLLIWASEFLDDYGTLFNNQLAIAQEFAAIFGSAGASPLPFSDRAEWLTTMAIRAY